MVTDRVSPGDRADIGIFLDLEMQVWIGRAPRVPAAPDLIPFFDRITFLHPDRPLFQVTQGGKQVVIYPPEIKQSEFRIGLK